MADLTQEPNAHDKGVFGPVTNRGSLVPLLPPPGALGTCQNTTNGLQPTVPPVAFVKKAQLLLITKRVSLACYTRCFAT